MSFLPGREKMSALKLVTVARQKFKSCILPHEVGTIFECFASHHMYMILWWATELVKKSTNQHCKIFLFELCIFYKNASRNPAAVFWHYHLDFNCLFMSKVWFLHASFSNVSVQQVFDKLNFQSSLIFFRSYLGYGEILEKSYRHQERPY